MVHIKSHLILTDEQKLILSQKITEMLLEDHKIQLENDMSLYDGVQNFQLQCLMMILQWLQYGKRSNKIVEHDQVEDEELDELQILLSEITSMEQQNELEILRTDLN